MMPGPDGVMNMYCDGGVASNSPVGIAHALAKGADIVLLDPPFEPEEGYDDAIEIAFAAYGTMQRKIFEMEMRTSYFQSLGKNAFDRLFTAQRDTARRIALSWNRSSRTFRPPAFATSARRRCCRSASSASTTRWASTTPIVSAGKIRPTASARTTGERSSLTLRPIAMAFTALLVAISSLLLVVWLFNRRSRR